MLEKEHRCIFCGQIAIDGIRLRGKLICAECEKELIQTRVDEPAYQGYKDGLKAIWDKESDSTQQLVE